MKKIRINVLARELEVKSHLILELLPELGVSEKLTHSSSIDDDVADKLRVRFGIAPGGNGDRSPEHGDESEPQSHGVAVEEPPQARPEPERREPPKPPEAAHTPPPTKSETTAEQPPTEAPSRLALPLRPPISSQPSTPSRPAPVQAKPLPVGPRPGQVLPPPAGLPPPSGSGAAPAPGAGISGPRQPFPGGLPEGSRAPVIPRPPAGPRTTPPPGPPGQQPIRPVAASGAPGLPAAPRLPLPQRPPTGQPGGLRPPTRPGLVGQPAQRPVVPPRPDLVARLSQPKTLAPGQPAAPRPGVPIRQPGAPTPGQPIYKGPVRTAQPMVGRPGMRTGTPAGRPVGPRPMHPTSRSPLGIEPPPTGIEQRRPQQRSGARPQRGERTPEREERVLRGPTRRESPAAPPPITREITISEGITVKELSEKLDVKSSMVIKKLVDRNIFATINQTLDAKLANELARDFGASVNTISFEQEAMADVQEAEVEADRVKRAPVVTIMGHVDHGKTSLLDAIRLANVAEKEAGGITQHIGAYHVEKNGRKIVFIDTPGHEAFTRMRSRGAKVTDIVVLVVAADDGVMPQTLEAIDHARAAGAPIIVAVNKIDKPNAQPERVKQQLADRGLQPEEWGGETVMVNVSAKQKTNLDLLLEMILLVADLQDLKANPDRPAMGTVLEAKLDRGRGPVATVLVRNGTLRVGDFFICGLVFGKVRAMLDDRGQPVREVEPSMPVEVLGLESLPEAGDAFQVVTDTAKAKQIVIYREAKAREIAMAKNKRLTLDQLHQQMQAGEVKELPIILKADVSGSAEVVSETLQKLSNEKVKIRVLHSGVGAITESDVLLASASNAIIIGFNVRPERNAASVAEQEKVDIRLHTIIYNLTDEIKKAMTGLLSPVFKETYRGKAEVRDTFRVTKVGTVAGCIVQDGILTRSSEVRVLRDNVVVHTGKIGSLRRFKDDVSEVKSGMECGVTLDNFGDVKQGDILEAFSTEKVSGELFA
jgi:translation initiation factor IF-2